MDIDTVPAAPQVPDQLADLRRLTTDAARLMAESNLLLIERLATEAITSPDLEFVRKVSSDFTNGSVGPEKREATKATAGAVRAFLQIILDPSVPQEPPPKRAARALQDVEDAVLVEATPTAEDMGWSEALQ
jgi:hypothetical protein